MQLERIVVVDFDDLRAEILQEMGVEAGQWFVRDSPIGESHFNNFWFKEVDERAQNDSISSIAYFEEGYLDNPEQSNYYRECNDRDYGKGWWEPLIKALSIVQTRFLKENNLPLHEPMYIQYCW